jgi:predicted lipoprotein with Yx(FWY)xxD motif
MADRRQPSWRRFTLTIAAAALVVAAATITASAIARVLTLQVDRSGKVTNTSGTTRTQAIVVGANGHAVYDLTGDRRGHAECTKGNGCFMFWPPVTVSSPHRLSKAGGIKGKLGTWHRNGFFQVTLNGHPLYRYAGDTRRGHATGEGLRTFGGTWHVIRASVSAVKPAESTATSTTTTSTTTSTSSMPCLYPPCD